MLIEAKVEESRFSLNMLVECMVRVEYMVGVELEKHE
jgi:hypothetical protein